MVNTIEKPTGKIVVRDFSRGVVNKIHALNIPDNSFADGQDCDPFTPGIVQTRNGYTSSASFSGSGSTYTIRGLFHFAKDNASAQKKILAFDSKVGASQGIYSWGGSGSTFTSEVVTGHNTATEIDAAVVNGKLYYVDGSGAVGEYTSTGATTGTHADISGSPSACTTLTYWQGRLWAGGQDTNGGYLYYSSVFAPTSWDTTVKQVRVGFNTGQKIVAARPRRSGELIVFLERSIWVVTPLGDAFNNQAFGFPTIDLWQPQEIDPTIGCGSLKSVAVLGNDMIFMDQYANIRSLQVTLNDAAQGSKSLPISDAIQGFVDRINKAALSQCAAIVFGNRYYISVPLDSAVVNSHTFVLDVTTGAWTGPWTFGMNRWLISDVGGSSGEYRLYGSKAENSFVLYRVESGTSDNGSAITMQLTTKRFDFGDLDIDKIGETVLSNIVVDSDGTMTVEASVNGGGFSTIGTMDTDGGAGTLPQTAPYFLGGGGIAYDNQSLLGKKRWKEIQLRFSCSTLDVKCKLLGYSILAWPEGIRKNRG